MCNHIDEMTKEEQTAAGDFVNTLKCCGYKCVPLSPRPKPDVIKALKEVCESTFWSKVDLLKATVYYMGIEL